MSRGGCCNRASHRGQGRSPQPFSSSGGPGTRFRVGRGPRGHRSPLQFLSASASASEKGKKREDEPIEPSPAMEDPAARHRRILQRRREEDAQAKQEASADKAKRLGRVTEYFARIARQKAERQREREEQAAASNERHRQVGWGGRDSRGVWWRRRSGSPPLWQRLSVRFSVNRSRRGEPVVTSRLTGVHDQLDSFQPPEDLERFTHMNRHWQR